jgi:hypothetical protein
MDFRRACIFIDGENLRHSLVDLFGLDFNPSDYLPKTADWQGFFDFLVKEAHAEMRLRAYWYVVDEIDFWPYGLNRLRKDPVTMERVVRSHKPYGMQLNGIADPVARAARVREIMESIRSQ